MRSQKGFSRRYELLTILAHSDDDTFFPDFDSLVRLLSSYDASGDWLIGTLSESTKQVRPSLASSNLQDL